MKKIALFIAVRDEAESILSNGFYGWEKVDGYDGDFYKSHNFPLELVITGIGKVYSAYKVSYISKDVEKIIIMGTSGGLSDEKIGDIYLIDEFIEHDMDVTGLGFEAGLTPFSPMKSPIIKNLSFENRQKIESICRNLGFDIKIGRQISGDTFLADRELTEKKRVLFKANLVDMESASIAKIAVTLLNKEVFAIRYVTDNANHEAGNNWLENVKKSSLIFDKILKGILMEFK